MIGAGEQIMLIVPQDEALTVETRIAPQDIYHVHVGQPATVRFSGLNPRTSVDLHGTVTRVSADVVQDAKTGASFYSVRAAVPDRELAGLDGMRPIPGMPIEIFLQTNARTVLSYLTQALRDQISRAFRE